jgi:hypothetical protein
MAKWSPDPKVQPLLAAIAKAEQRQRTMTRNQRLGRDADGRSPMFESLLPSSRGATSPLGGVAQPAEQVKRR